MTLLTHRPVESPATRINVSPNAGPSEACDHSSPTSLSGTSNASEALCERCGRVISEHRLKHAIRSKQPARWCCAACRVAACQARKDRRRSEEALRKREAL